MLAPGFDKIIEFVILETVICCFGMIVFRPYKSQPGHLDK